MQTAVQPATSAHPGAAAAPAHSDAAHGHVAHAAAAKSVEYVRQHRRACVAMSMLLVLKSFLKSAYSIKADAIAAFTPDKSR